MSNSKNNSVKKLVRSEEEEVSDHIQRQHHIIPTEQPPPSSDEEIDDESDDDDDDSIPGLMDRNISEADEWSQQEQEEEEAGEPLFFYTGQPREVIFVVQHVVVAEEVTTIQQRAFCQLRLLQSIVIPSSVHIIKPCAFMGCPNLTTVKFLTGDDNDNSGLKKIEFIAFRKCTSLNSINIPSTVREIGGGAFLGCKSLCSIKLPEGLEKINCGAFQDCTSLISINIPSTVREIGGVFMGCKSLRSIELLEGLEKINCGAFQCTSLISINIPSTVREIRERAFLGCKSLEIVQFQHRPELRLFGFRMFDNCPNLKSIHIPPIEEDKQQQQQQANKSRYNFHSLRYYYRFREDGRLNIDGMNSGFIGPTTIRFYWTNNNNNHVNVVRTNDYRLSPGLHQPPPRSQIFDDFDYYKNLCRGNENSLNNHRSIDVASISLVSKQQTVVGFQVKYRHIDINGKTTEFQGPINCGCTNPEVAEVFHMKVGEYILGLKVFTSLGKIHGITFVTNIREVHLGGRCGFYDPYSLMISDVGYPTTSFGSQVVVALAATCTEDGNITGIGIYARHFNWFAKIYAKECMKLRWLLERDRAKAKSEDENDIVVKLIKLEEKDAFREVLGFLH